MLDTGQRMHFGLDGGRHECGEPPGHHFRPECGVHNVEGLQILLVSVAEKSVRQVRQQLQIGLYTWKYIYGGYFPLTCMARHCRPHAANATTDSCWWMWVYGSMRWHSRPWQSDLAALSDTAVPNNGEQVINACSICLYVYILNLTFSRSIFCAGNHLPQNTITGRPRRSTPLW